MTTDAQLAELIRVAQERAATEVETWIPEKPGDSVAGKVIELGSIVTVYGEYMTTTVETIDEPKRTVRIAWMGAVLEAQFKRMQPRPNDIVAVHYQKDVSPKSGMQDYRLIVAVVIDGSTGLSKTPINLDISIPTENQIVHADPETGEIPSMEEFRNRHPKPEYEPFEDDDVEEKPSASKAKTK